MVLALTALPAFASDDDSAERARAFIRQFDGNGDGHLTLDEVDAAQLSRFVEIDTNKDRVISIAEVRAWKGVKGQNPALWIRRFDRNGDNQLDVSEYVDQVVKMVKRFDSNDNGWVTQREVHAAIRSGSSRD